MKKYNPKIENKKSRFVYVIKFCNHALYPFCILFGLLIMFNPHNIILIIAGALGLILIVCGAIGGSLLVHFFLNWITEVRMK